MKKIIVNNPAAKNGGALTILVQFIENIKKYDFENRYIFFVTLRELKKYEDDQIKIIVLKDIKGLKRLYWDYFGLRKWCQKNLVIPKKIISLQNTGVFYKGIPQIIYEHQALIFSDEKWNFLKKEEKKYWFYKKIYPFFIRITINKNTTLIVQSEWMKEKFKIFLKNKKYNKIKVIPPTLNLYKYKYEEEELNIKKEKYNLFYPASSEVLKNHMFLINIVSELKKKNYSLYKKICIYFTFNLDERLDIMQEIKKRNIAECFKFIGNQKYNTIINYYKNVDALIFLSKIESFGLPLLEAYNLGLKTIVVDKPYSKHLKNIKNFIVEPENIESWTDIIIKEIKNKKLQKVNIVHNISLDKWSDFFEEIKRK